MKAKRPDPAPPRPAPSIVPGLDPRAADVLASEGAGPPPVGSGQPRARVAANSNRRSLPPWAWIAGLAVLMVVVLFIFAR
jgi:hypothetical protein